MKLTQIGGGGCLLGLEIRVCFSVSPNLGPLSDDAVLNRSSDCSVLTPARTLVSTAPMAMAPTMTYVYVACEYHDKGLEFKRGHTHSLPVWDLSSFQTTEPSHFHYDLALRTSTRRFGLHPAPCACTIPVLQLSSDPVSSWLMPKKMLSRPNDQF